MSGLGFRAKLVFLGRTRVALDLGVNCRGIVEEYHFGFNAWVLGNNNVYHNKEWIHVYFCFLESALLELQNLIAKVRVVLFHRVF